MRGLVYNQVWEDYAVDQLALRVGPGDRVFMVTSGGCNVLNTALERPDHIVCVDGNPAQHALLLDKMRLIQYGSAEQLWDQYGAPAQRRPDSAYRRGAYGNFHHVRAFFRLRCGAERLEAFLEAPTLARQAALAREEIDPRLWHPVVRAVPSPCVALFGVHPRQLVGALRGGALTLEQICRDRLLRIFTDHPIRENYYWFQMLHGSYHDPERAPAYLNPAHFQNLRAALPCIEPRVSDILSALRDAPSGAFSCCNLLDLPDFLSGSAQRELFRELARVSQPGARVLFRSFAPWRESPWNPAHFTPQVAESERLSRLERTASYGRVTLLHRAPGGGA